jgi:hypothetical protein
MGVHSDIYYVNGFSSWDDYGQRENRMRAGGEEMDCWKPCFDIQSNEISLTFFPLWFWRTSKLTSFEFP